MGEYNGLREGEHERGGEGGSREEGEGGKEERKREGEGGKEERKREGEERRREGIEWGRGKGLSRGGEGRE